MMRHLARKPPRRAHLNLFGKFICMIAVFNMIVGLGTLDGYSGRPEDAPHLHVSEVIRGCAWVLMALAAIALVWWAARGPRMLLAQRVALGLLQVMPTVRGVSHLYAWVLSWPVWEIGPGPRRWWQEGSPAGWYTCAPWLGEVAVILTLAYCVGRFGHGGEHAPDARD